MSRIIKSESVAAATAGRASAMVPAEPRLRQGSRTAAGVVDAAEIVHSARVRAAAILQGAQGSASRMLEEAARQAEALREQAVREGYRDGYEAGAREGRERAEREGQRRWQEALRAVQSAVQELGKLRSEAVAAAEADMVKFALLAAEKILRKELANPERTLDIARSLLAEVRDESRITLYLPEGVQLAEDEALKLADGDSSGGIQLVVKHDPTLSLGDVRIETAWGWIDGRASVRWQRLVEALRRGIDDDGDD